MQLLKQALEEGSWEKVSQAYEVLTGEHIGPPETFSATLESKVPSIDSIIDDLTFLKDITRKKRGRPKGSKAKKADIPTKEGKTTTTEVDTGKRIIKFVTGETLTKEEEAEKVMYKPPVERRDSYTGVTATCSKCGRTFDRINPQFIKPDPDVRGGVYTCNGCQSRR